MHQGNTGIIRFSANIFIGLSAMNLQLAFIFLIASISLFGCDYSYKRDSLNTNYPYKVLNSYPHDRTAQTEGLFFLDGFLYEGTGPGLGTPSSLRKVEIKSGKVLRLRKLPGPFFGEGITIHKDRIIQLTYQSQRGFIYERESFELLDEFNYKGEGWGITHDGKNLIMSNGTSRLYYLDPVNYEEIRELEVYDDYGLLSNLNELEYIKGEIYANVFRTPYIARISPETGRIIGLIDLSKLLRDWIDDPEIMDNANGIAYDQASGRLYVTGKYWPRLFEIQMISQPDYSFSSTPSSHRREMVSSVE